MERSFTQEQESQLAQFARRDGKTDAGEVLKDKALRLLEEEEMAARFEQMLRS